MPRVRRSLGSLGDDTLDAMDDTAWKREMLASTKRVEVAQRQWFEGDLMWKRLGVVATIMIPVSAALWRAIGIGRKRKKDQRP